MEIRWSPEAAEDFERVVRRMQSDNLTAARKVADTIHPGSQT
jgi:plasmid stabilization system protein ParE